MYYTYILKSKVANKTYVGITNDKDRRLEQHNRGLHFYTRRYIPWVLVYSEHFESRLEARKKEMYLKSHAGRKWMKKRIFNNALVAELAYAIA